MAPEPLRFPFPSVAILGLGVMGGSLARALAALEPKPVVTGWAPDPAHRAAAWEAGVLSAAPDDVAGCAAGARLVVLAAPLEATCALLETLRPILDPETLVTDVASLKVPPRDAASRGGLEDRWVGSHPMCGSADSGFAASREDLFRGAPVYVTDGADGEALQAISAAWAALGARPVATSPEAHDRLMAAVSHLPQLTANALAEVLRAEGVEPSSLGPGGRDMTRLAGSSPEMWRDILEHAPAELVGHLRHLSREAGELADLLEEGDAESVARRMEETRRWKRGDA